jgi:MFS family permease
MSSYQTRDAGARLALSAASPEQSQRRSAWLLAACQALYTSSVSIDLTLTGIVGYMLAPNKALATLPFALITVFAAITTIFASLLMARIGRRLGFILGASVGAGGGVISVLAILHHNFVFFCVGTATVGVFQAFAQYYRLAAADAVETNAKSRAISIVLTGGVIAAVAGPAIATWSKDLLLPSAFAGSYVVVSVFGLLSVGLLALFYRDAAPAASTAGTNVVAPRPLREIVCTPIFAAALANNAIGYAVMMFVMTAAPIAAVGCGYSIAQGAHIIQWHLVGMFGPSLFAGHLIKRFGELPIISTGILLSATCGVLVLHSTELPFFYAALACLGVGWNFMFVGGTTLLAKSYRSNERAKTQAASEFSTFAFSACGSLAAGQVLMHYSWSTVNIIIFPALLIAAMTTLWYARSRPVILAKAI